MKTTIIGANSYIARNMIYINQSKGYTRLKLFDYAQTQIDQAEPYQPIDVMNTSELEDAILNADLVYFFIGKTGTIKGFENPEDFLNINEKTLLNLLNACKRKNRRCKIVFPSTRLVYKGSAIPQREDAPKMFLTPYAIQKFACENYLEMYYKMYEINYCIVRICVPFGTLVTPVNSYGTLDFFVNQAKKQKNITV